MSSAVIDIRWFWVAPELVLTFAGLAGLLAAAMRTLAPSLRALRCRRGCRGTVLRGGWIAS